MNQDMTVLETETDMRTRWYLTQRIVQDVWTRWRSEYLSQLTARSKWNKAQPNIQINDVVTINDANLPPGKWAVGRVVDLHPGTDGHVRVVTLQTKNGLIKRPVIKLSVLPVHDKRKDQDGIVNQPNVQTSNRPKPAKHSFVSLLTLLLFIMSILSTGHCSYNVTQMKNNQGLYFEKVANMRLIRDEWKIVSYYDMATYWRGTKACNTYIKYLEQLCTKLGGNSHCDVLSVQLQLEYSELDYNNNLLLRTGTRRDKRKRRGLINGVGYLANTLFGVLDDEFAEQYKRDIQLTRDNENHLASLIKNQTSIIEVEYNILKRTEDSLDKQHKMLNQLSLKIVDLTQTLNTVAERNQFSNEFSLVAIAASNLLRQLETIQSTLLDTLLDVYQGRFNFHLISQAQLQDTLSTISSHLTKDLSLPIKRIGGDFTNIYRFLRVKAKMCKEYLIFELKLPLITRDSFEIMKILPIPRAISNSKMARMLPIAEYVAINLRKEFYVQMTSLDLNSCELDAADEYLCHVHRPIYRLRQDERFCKRDHGTGRCEISISQCTNEWTELESTNKYMYFCCGTCYIRVLCDNNNALAGQIERAGILSLEQECLIKTENFTIYLHNVGLSYLHMKPKMYAPAIEPFNHVINASIPISEVQNYSSHTEQLEELKKQIDILKANENIADRVSFHDIHHYTITYVIVVVALLIGAALAVRRVRGRPLPREAAGKVDEATPPVPTGINERSSSLGPSQSETQVYSVSARNNQCNVKCVSDEQSECEYSEIQKVNKVDKCITPMPRKAHFN